MHQPIEQENNKYQTDSYEFMTEKGLLFLETGMMPFGKREHPLEAKIANLETRQLGYHSLEYDAYVNLFDENDKLIGGVQLQRRWNLCKLYSLWVDDEFRGLGLGNVLMEQAENLCVLMTANSIMLETSTLHNFEFYLNNGFEIVNAFEGVIPGEVFYIMTKALNLESLPSQPEAGQP